MLKSLFWSLLLLNLGLFAYQRGYLNALLPDGREPARMSQQFNADKMKPIAKPLITPSAAGDSTASIATSAAAEASAASKPETIACTEIGDFDNPAAKRFETQLSPLKLGERLSHRDIQDAARNMVYIPSQGSKEGADKKVTELRHLGVNDFFVIQEAGELHWAISLGVFKTEEAARAQLVALNQKGVHSARLGVHNLAPNKLAYQLHNLTSDEKAGIDKIAHDFPAASMRACQSNVVADNKPAAPAPKITLPRDAFH